MAPTGVPVNTAITLNFNEAIGYPTLLERYASLYGHDEIYSSWDYPHVTATLSADGKSVTLTPVSSLMSLVDASVLQRMDSGSLRVDVGAQWPRATFGFAKLPETERAALFQAFRAVGRTGEVVVSLWQGEGGTRERDHQFMGRIATDMSAGLQTWERFGSRLEVVGS